MCVMASGGDGTIGGGGSCFVNFIVEDGKGFKRLHAFDNDAKEGCIITVSFPGSKNPDVRVPLKDGPCVKISWQP